MDRDGDAGSPSLRGPSIVPELLMVEVYCCPTVAKFAIFLLKTFLFLRLLQAKRRADERTRTADLLITSEFRQPSDKRKTRI